MSNIPIALQLYTLREQAAHDFVGVLKAVAAIGYVGVELAGMHGLSAAELKKVLDDLGLKVCASHIALSDLEYNQPQVFEDNHTLGNARIVVPWLPEERRRTADDWRHIAALLNQIGAQCAAAGFELCYHHHSFEFQKFGDETGFDLIFENTDPALVKAEIDVYWAKDGGHDPAALIQRFKNRVPLVHLKDMTADTPPTFVEVGEGIIDFAAVLRACRESGVQWYIVEQDVCQRPPLESVRISWQNLQKLL